MSARQISPQTKVLQDLVDILEPQVQAKEITHLLAGIFVKGDAAQLTRLFSNLLENAFKYTPAGSVILSMAAVCPCQCEGYRHGIAPEYLPFIFSVFGDPTELGLDG